MHKLILASSSPRRKQILQDRGYEFRAFPLEVSEILDKNLNISDQISDCAHQKAVAAFDSLKLPKTQDILILSADTVVVLDGQVLGKPKNKAHACEVLASLSGKKHQVITGFCLVEVKSKRFILGHETTQVEFNKLTENEISDYVNSGEPMDKAGSYGIQGEGQKFVKEIQGSYLNVVGLPIEKIEQVIAAEGWSIEKRI